MWEDPSARPSSGPAGSWSTRLAPLVEQPRRWAIVGAFSSGTASALRTRGNSYRLPAGTWEFVSRRRRSDGEPAPAGKVWVYARYLGGEMG